MLSQKQSVGLQSSSGRLLPSLRPMLPLLQSLPLQLLHGRCSRCDDPSLPHPHTTRCSNPCQTRQPPQDKRRRWQQQQSAILLHPAALGSAASLPLHHHPDDLAVHGPTQGPLHGSQPQATWHRQQPQCQTLSREASSNVRPRKPASCPFSLALASAWEGLGVLVLLREGGTSEACVGGRHPQAAELLLDLLPTALPLRQPMQLHWLRGKVVQ